MAVIVATGPSANAEPLEIVRGNARVFAIKSSWRLAPWADALYGLDRDWWIAHRGAPEFAGLKFSPSPTVCRVYRDVREVRLKTRAQVLTETTGVVGCGLPSGGGHSGFQALNLAVQFGANTILLVGFDMTLAHGEHWFDSDPGTARADAHRTATWRNELDACAPQFKALGIDVINCSPRSALTSYPKMSLSEAMKWPF